MRADVLRLYKTVHTWTGLVAGLALFVAFYAGALTMFREPLDRWAAPRQAQPADLAQAPRLIALALAAHPATREAFTLELHATADAPARLDWDEPAPSGTDADVAWSATLAADGRLAAGPAVRPGLGAFVDDLHQTAGIPGRRGVLVMGIVGALYVLALVSGVVVLLPTLVKDLFALRLGRNLKRLWLDVHNALGLLSLPFHVVMALTAVVFGFHTLLYDIEDRVIYGRAPAAVHVAPAHAGPARPPVADALPPAALLARLRQRAPGFEPLRMTYLDAGDPARAQVVVSGEDPRFMLRLGGEVHLDPYTGRWLDDEDFPGRMNAWNALAASFFALHFGSFGGAPVRWAYFFLGLAGAFLFYSGNLLWIESRRRRERGDGAVAQRRSTRLMACVTVGVSLGCIVGVSVAIAFTRWTHGQPGLEAWRWGLYYAAFLGGTLWAFLRGAPRAAAELLWLAAAATAAIPLTSMAAWLASPAPVATAEPGVDVVAAVGACAFAWMARATARRAEDGGRDSVWHGREAAGRGA